MDNRLVGALARWKRREVTHGIALTLDIAPSAESFDENAFVTVTAILNDQQLRSLAQDLVTAASERGVDIAARARWKIW
jgi:hypothetical protein